MGVPDHLNLPAFTDECIAMSTSDLQLRRMGLKPMSHLPNREGFAFIGTLRNGVCLGCHVVRDVKTGLRSVAGAEFTDLIGWK